jgi:hypothetical protein
MEGENKDMSVKNAAVGAANNQPSFDIQSAPLPKPKPPIKSPYKQKIG